MSNEWQYLPTMVDVARAEKDGWVDGLAVRADSGAQGMDALLMMAAVVEMTEPSNRGVERPDGGIIAGGSGSNAGFGV